MQSIQYDGEFFDVTLCRLINEAQLGSWTTVRHAKVDTVKVVRPT